MENKEEVGREKREGEVGRKQRGGYVGAEVESCRREEREEERREKGKLEEEKREGRRGWALLTSCEISLLQEQEVQLFKVVDSNSLWETGLPNDFSLLSRGQRETLASRTPNAGWCRNRSGTRRTVVKNTRPDRSRNLNGTCLLKI